MKMIITTLIMLFAVNSSWACKVKSPVMLNLGSSTTDQLYFSYGAKSLLDEVPFAEITNCVQTAQQKKYLMIAFGPEVIEAEDTYRGTNFNKGFVESSCKIKNNPLENILSGELQEKNFLKKWKYIENCIEVHVTDIGSRPISVDEVQAGCTAKVVTPKSAVFKGGYCFFKPNFDSSYNVTIRVAPECTTKEFYKTNNVPFADISGNISFYTSAQNEGELGGLTAIGTHPVRVSTNIVKELMEPSDDFGVVRPTFPISYPLTDLHLGKIAINEMGSEYLAIKSPIIVDHTCRELSAAGLTSSACDYSIPVVAEVTLKDQKGHTIISWYDGGVAQAQWQGMISGEGVQILKSWLVPGQKYSLEYNFGEPHYDFNYFKGRVKNKIGLINSRLPVITMDGEIREISTIRDLEDIDDMIEVDPIAGLRLRDPIVGLATARRRLNGYFSSTMWPPIYKNVCLTSTGKCAEFNTGFAKFIATFKYGEDFSVNELQIERKSQLLGHYKKTITDQPEYICE